MRASDILKAQNRPIQSILETATVQEAINQMVEQRIGSLLVFNAQSALIGIITERDILRESAADCQRMKETKVSEVMTKDLVTARSNDEINDLLELMTLHRIRHLPIINGARLEGLVSIGDLVAAQLREIKEENEQLKDYIQQPR